jgi:hypothetical protein
LVWANTHASVALGLLIILAYAIGATLKSYFPDFFGDPFPNEKPLPVWATFAAALALSFLNPNGYRVLTYSFTVKKALSALVIQEWQPITAFFNEWGAKGFAFELVVVTLFFIWQFFREAKNRDITILGLIIGVAVLPFAAVRHVGWWPLIIVPPLALLISRIIENHLTSAASLIERISILVLITLLLVGVWRAPRTYFNHDLVPVYAADFIQKTGLQGPFYNFYNQGGYFIWRLWHGTCSGAPYSTSTPLGLAANLFSLRSAVTTAPWREKMIFAQTFRHVATKEDSGTCPGQKVFIDGRSEVYAGEPMQEFIRVAHADPGSWKALVDQKYHLNYFVLPYRPAELGKSLLPLYTRLIKEGWIFVWWDDSAVVFIRPAQANLNIASRYAIRYVGPWTDPGSIPAADRRAAGLEIQALLDRVPQSLVIRDYAFQFLAKP